MRMYFNYEGAHTGELLCMRFYVYKKNKINIIYIKQFLMDTYR